MVAFSKFLTGRRGSRELLDTDSYTYNKRKERTSADELPTWRCSKNWTKKCPYLVSFCSSDQQLSSTHGILTETLASSTLYLNVNFPKSESQAPQEDSGHLYIFFDSFEGIIFDTCPKA